MNEYIYIRAINTVDGDDADGDSAMVKTDNVLGIVNRGIGSSGSVSGLDLFIKPVRNLATVGNEKINNDNLALFTHHDTIKQAMEAIVTLINSKNDFNIAMIADDVAQGEVSGTTELNPFIDPRLAKLPSIKTLVGARLADGTTVVDPGYNNFAYQINIANEA